MVKKTTVKTTTCKRTRGKRTRGKGTTDYTKPSGAMNKPLSDWSRDALLYESKLQLN